MWYVINYSNLKKILAINIASISIFILCTPLRALPLGEHFNALYISTPVGYILYYILSYQLCKRYNVSIRPCITLTIILCTFILIQLPVRLFDFRWSAITLPEQFIHLLGIISGYLSFQKHIKKWVIIILGGVYYSLFIALFPMFYNYLNYGSITEKMGNIPMPNFKMINEKKDTLSLQELNDDYIILYLWHKRCSSCIRSFPKLQRLHQIIQSKNNLSIYVLNYPIDDTDPFLFMKDRGYEIPTLQLLNRNKDIIKEQIGINTFPTTIILNKKHQLIFKGNLETAEIFLINQIIHTSN